MPKLSFRSAPDNIRTVLHGVLSHVAAHPAQFALNKHCFCRKRILDLERLLHILFQMDSHTLATNLSNVSGDRKCPSVSAFVQQRDKLSLKAVTYIFYEMQRYIDRQFKHRISGYRLLACDGSDFPMPSDVLPVEEELTVQQRVQHRLLHLNALFDVLTGQYVEVDIRPKKICNERNVLLDMLAHCRRENPDIDPSKTIIVCDRGYESYDVLTRLCKSGFKFIIRAQGPDKNNVLRGFHDKLKENEPLDRTLKLRAALDAEGRYRPCKSRSNKDVEVIRIRVVAKALKEGSKEQYEYILTNLPKKASGPDGGMEKRTIFRIYRKRWAIETSFRHLKYGIGAIVFHSRKQEVQKMELYISATLYNCVHAITSLVKLTEQKGKYRYKLNFTEAVPRCIAYLFGILSEAELGSRLKQNLVPIRPNRKNSRAKLRHQRARGFSYRSR